MSRPSLPNPLARCEPELVERLVAFRLLVSDLLLDRLAAAAARVERLDQLSRGLAREVSLIRQANEPMLYLERKAYLSGMGDALQGIESARVVLAKACQRLDGHGP
jgi:hypothetical protein